MSAHSRFTPVLLTCVLAPLLVLIPAAGGESRQRSAPAASAFAKTNLHAWAFEEYDAVSRSPAERAQVLETVGLTKAGYIGRNVERMKEFDAYVAAYNARKIELVAVWTPVNTDAPLQEPQIQMFLEAAERHKLRIQWWVTLEQLKQAGEQTVDKALTLVRNLNSEASKRGLRLALYGHGRDSWFTQPENQLDIIRRLPPADAAAVGIAYNFHHAHSQLDRFAAVFPKMLPHLMAVNLNGMKAEGPMILPVGEGDREQEMISIIHKSGYRGPVGVLHHQRTIDAAKGLARNIAGLRQILVAIGDSAGASTYEPPMQAWLGAPWARPPERGGALGGPASDGAGESEGRSPSDPDMTGKFVAAAEIPTDRLDWGDLAWISRPSTTGSSQITEALVTLAPGFGHDFHRHPQQEELLYVLSGTVEQWIEGEKRTLSPGDAVFVSRGVVHASFNTGTEDAKFLVVLSPSAGEGGYESEEVAAQPPWNGLRN